ncbi:MAG: YcxB family protein [Coprococcus sp.]
MEDKNVKFDVKMNKKAMKSFLFYHNYANIGGILGIVVSIMAIALFIWKMNILGIIVDGILLLIGLLFTVIKPVMIIIQTGNIMRNEMCYKSAISYTFDNEGVVIVQENEKEFLPWTKVKKVALTDCMLALYDTKSHAFIIPLEELQENKQNIIKLTYNMTKDNGAVIAGKFKKYIDK